MSGTPSPSPAPARDAGAASSSSAAAAAAEVPDRVRRFLSRAPGDALANLLRADAAWTAFRNRVATTATPSPAGTPTPTTTPVVFTYNAPLGPDTRVDFDVVVCGGTLGIFLAAALQRAGRAVAVVERGPLRGRDQDWNISRDELVHGLAAILTPDQLDAALSLEFNPMRVAFSDRAAAAAAAAAAPTRAPEFATTVNDVLNLGVSPARLIAMVRDEFLRDGGALFEHAAFRTLEVFPDAARVTVTPRPGATPGGTGATGAGGAAQFAATGDGDAAAESIVLHARLVVDCMGNFSPIAIQARGAAAAPDAVCVVVGSCADGFGNGRASTGGDLMVAVSGVDPSRRQQYFWESFPALDGRTTYVFAYSSADTRRPSLVQLFDDYLARLPAYVEQGGAGGPRADGAGLDVDALEPRRVFFGFFPAYKRHAPLRPVFDRVLHVGDASGLQSPLSFGGFGALMRHLPRLTNAIDEALDKPDRLTARKLRLLTPYQPNLAVTWLFQKAMSVSADPARPVKDADLVLKVLSTMFSVMSANKDQDVMLTFLRDVVRFRPLALSILGMTFRDVRLSVAVLGLVGIGSLLEWTLHFVALGVYDLLSRAGEAVSPWVVGKLGDDQRYAFARSLEAWQYGSGRDPSRDENDNEL